MPGRQVERHQPRPLLTRTLKEPHRQDAPLLRPPVEGLNSQHLLRLVLLLGGTGHQGGAGIPQTQLQQLPRSSVSVTSVVL